ncbi:MAG: hypothetical protein AAGA30_09445, partial [Planctomycetota bacterium]
DNLLEVFVATGEAHESFLSDKRLRSTQYEEENLGSLVSEIETGQSNSFPLSRKTSPYTVVATDVLSPSEHGATVIVNGEGLSTVTSAIATDVSFLDNYLHSRAPNPSDFYLDDLAAYADSLRKKLISVVDYIDRKVPEGGYVELNEAGTKYPIKSRLGFDEKLDVLKSIHMLNESQKVLLEYGRQDDFDVPVNEDIAVELSYGYNELSELYKNGRRDRKPLDLAIFGSPFKNKWQIILDEVLNETRQEISGIIASPARTYNKKQATQVIRKLVSEIRNAVRARTTINLWAEMPKISIENIPDGSGAAFDSASNTITFDSKSLNPSKITATELLNLLGEAVHESTHMVEHGIVHQPKLKNISDQNRFENSLIIGEQVLGDRYFALRYNSMEVVMDHIRPKFYEKLKIGYGSSWVERHAYGVENEFVNLLHSEFFQAFNTDNYLDKSDFGLEFKNIPEV